MKVVTGFLRKIYVSSKGTKSLHGSYHILYDNASWVVMSLNVGFVTKSGWFEDAVSFLKWWTENSVRNAGERREEMDRDTPLFFSQKKCIAASCSFMLAFWRDLFDASFHFWFLPILSGSLSFTPWSPCYNSWIMSSLYSKVIKTSHSAIHIRRGIFLFFPHDGKRQKEILFLPPSWSI